MMTDGYWTYCGDDFVRYDTQSYVCMCMYTYINNHGYYLIFYC